MKTNERRYKEIRAEIGYLRDGLIGGIRNGKKEWVNEGLEVYKELTKVFMRKMKQLGEGYSKERALAEESSIGGGWDEIRWLQDDVADFINEAFLQDNVDILRAIIYFPISIARSAFHERDFYIYHKFISLIPFLTTKALTLTNKQLQKIAVDRSWRHLKEFSVYDLKVAIEEAKEPEQIEIIEGYSIHVLRIFSKMLKEAADCYRGETNVEEKEKLFSFFHLVLSEYNKIFKLEIYEDYSLQIGRLQRAKGTITGEKDLEEIDNRIKYLESVQTYYEELGRLKKISLFGLNAWLLHCYEQPNLNADEYKKWHVDFGSYGNLQELTDIYIESRKDGVQGIFGWQWWELEEHESGEVFSALFHSLLSKLYGLKAIEITRGWNINEIGDKTVSMADRDLYLIDRPDSELMKILNDIYQTRGEWSFIKDIEIDPIMRVFENTVKLKQVEKASRIIEAPLDMSFVESLKQEFIKTWREYSTIRRILNIAEKTEGASPEGVSYIGLNRLENKEWFISGSNTSIEGLGKGFGEALASYENQIVLRLIMGAVEALENTKVAKEDLTKAIEIAMRDLAGKGAKTNAIISINSWVAPSILKKDVDYFKEMSKDTGKFRNVPVYFINFPAKGPEELDIVLVLDLEQIGHWKQYDPPKEYSEEERLAVFNFMLASFNDGTAAELIERQPEFKKERDGNAIRDLKQKVQLRIVEQFEYKILKKEAGYKIRLEKEY
jgi:hypothetical protein